MLFFIASNAGSASSRHLLYLLNARSNNYGLLRVCTASRISPRPNATISRGNPSSLRLDFELLTRDVPASGFALYQ